jgi:ssDNA-binding Zn-finger/Zn-ribbon topoisomerase 1
MSDGLKCPKCGSRLIVEASADGKVRTETCPKCGLTETKDQQGRKLLQEVPAVPQGRLLLG